MIALNLAMGACVPAEVPFGESVLSLFTLVDGKTLSYSYSNREVPNHRRCSDQCFQTILRIMAG